MIRRSIEAEYGRNACSRFAATHASGATKRQERHEASGLGATHDGAHADPHKATECMHRTLAAAACGARTDDAPRSILSRRLGASVTAAHPAPRALRRRPARPIP
jgi:hypothetical protein